MPLVRLTTQDGSWQAFVTQWAGQCERFEEDFAEYGQPTLDHAAKIAGEHPQDRKYGIYGFEEGGEIHAILHANPARLPGTTGTTLRALWIVLAPRYDFEQASDFELANLAAGIITGAVGLARSTEMPCQHVKVHIGDAFDRALFNGVTASLARDDFAVLSVRGNWLHAESLGAPTQKFASLPLRGG